MQVKKKSLLDGHLLTCPRCKTPHSVEQYMKLMEIEEFETETSKIYKCPSCKWIFALAVPEDFQNKLMELLSLQGSVAETGGTVN